MARETYGSRVDGRRGMRLALRVLQVITRAHIGGAPQHVLSILRGLRSRIQVELAVGCEGQLSEAARREGFPVHVVPHLVRSVRPWEDLAATRSFRKLLQDRRPDLVHAHTFKAGAVARLAGFMEGVPTIYTPHGWRFMPGSPKLWKWIGPGVERVLGRLAARVVCVSEYEKRLALELGVVPEEKLVVIANGIPELPMGMQGGERTKTRREHGEAIRAVMVGRFEAPKDQATLLRALARVADVNITLEFVGDGPMRRSTENLAEALGLRNRVRFLGERNDVPELLSEADLFILSSWFEGLPLALLEAMRSGLPVIASRVGGVTEAVIDGVTGILVPPGDPEALARALARMAASPRERVEMGQAGRRLFVARFREERMLVEIEALYKDTARQAARPRGMFGCWYYR